MKIAVIGAAGLRFPLLASGFARSHLPIEVVRCFDSDQEKLQYTVAIASALAPNLRFEAHGDPAVCVEDADFIFTSIRVGGMAGRARDEQICFEHGVLGQETIGPVGFAMALRSIAPMLEYAELIARYAPKAWVINFTNPVSIITQALFSSRHQRMVGICDSPTELFCDVANALELVPRECRFDYIGLNHLGFLQELYFNGEPQLQRLWENKGAAAKVYRHALFESDELEALAMLPSEYLYFYFHAEKALKNIAASGSSRGQMLHEQNEAFWASITSKPNDMLAIYESYLNKRDSSYMQIESDGQSTKPKGKDYGLTGYDKIALKVVEGIYFNSKEVLPLNVLNHGNIPDLLDDDVIEVPCLLSNHGPLPLHAGPLPEACKGLVMQVKHYERLTTQAALEQSESKAVEALAHNPLIKDRAQAKTLCDALGPFW
ncbi:MAG: hypothetical protein IPJ88_11550 [Myxococcales bacterium]|nr:MAG: hypothetical protein IPJ88_11550 [Myxococcales bacterium]